MHAPTLVLRRLAQHRSSAWVVVLALTAALVLAPPSSRPLYAGELPAPFDGWNVEVAPHGDDPQILVVDFDSPVLGLRARNLVWLPDSYVGSSEPHPVVYYLHGTASTTWGMLATPGDLPDLEAPPSSPTVRPDTAGFDQRLDRQTFVAVAPDAGVPWCVTCNWVDGLDGEGVLAETHLHEEVIPLVEALFRVRTDRGGRGITGHSMGGGGALIQGFRHPDRFAFVGSSSGTMTVNDDFISLWGGRWWVWNRHQGFGPPATHEIHLRNINLLDLTAQVAGTDMEIVAAIGDGCLDPRESEGACEDMDRTNYMQWAMEVYQRYGNNDVVAQRLIQAGVPITYVQREGPHNIGASTFERYFVDRLNEVFSRPPADPPATFTYKSVDRELSIWGWDVAVERPNHEFLHLNGGRTDGRSVTLGGTGLATVTTPATFEPGRAYEVVLTPAGQLGERQVVAADADGRITLTIDLGPTRTMDEREALVDQGLFQFPQTRLEILDRPRPRPDPRGRPEGRG